jgi:subtilisin family serine protease
MRLLRHWVAFVALILLSITVVFAATPISPSNGASGSSDSFATDRIKLDPILRGFIYTSPDHWRGLASIAPVVRRDNGPTVSVFLDGGVSDADIRRLGGEPHVRLRNGIVTADMPISSLRALAALPSLKRAEASVRRYPRLDKGVPEAMGNLADVRQTRGLTGKGVYVCVIDSGLDFEHPSFRNPDGTTRVYAFRDPESGQEFTAEQINTNPGALTKDKDSHGTHVTGIAAGTGQSRKGTTPFVGMAPEAGLLIAKSGSDQAMVDSIAWFNKQLDAIGTKTGTRPRAVVNMSLGGHLGPHDGTTLLDRSLDEFIDGGLPMAISAGNEYDSGLHASGRLANGQSATLTIIPPTGAEAPTSGNLTLDLWYSSRDVVDFSLLHKGEPITFQNGSTTVSLGSFAEATDGEGFIYVDHIDGGKSATEKSPDAFSGDERGGRRIFVTVTWNETAYHPKDLRLKLTAKTIADTGEWHAWIVTENGTKWENPDPRFTIGAPGTARKAITVASYVSRLTASSDAGLGEISTFSSSGPLRNGNPATSKPDIAAPGDKVVSAMASGSNASGDSVEGAPEDFVAFQGTSMSSPMVAGAIALMLQAKPSLTPAEIKSALQRSAVTTGSSERWGAGKMNLSAALRLFDAVTIQPAVLLTANPANGATVEKGATVTVTFDRDPGVVSAAGATIAGTGATRTLILAEATTTLTWKDGSATLTYVFAVAKNPNDINGDGIINIVDIIIVARNFGSAATVAPEADVNGDGLINILDLVLVARQFGTVAAPAVNGSYAHLLERLIASAYASDDGSDEFRRGIAALESILFHLVPTTTALLPNYPNPFNPETWIPFELSEASVATVSIFDATGELVRRFDLGALEAGTYRTRTKSLYWDGRNATGEPVATGVYFVELRTPSSRSTRRLIVSK